MKPDVQGLAPHFTFESLRAYLMAKSEPMPNGCREFRGNGRFPHAYQKVTLRA